MLACEIQANVMLFNNHLKFKKMARFSEGKGFYNWLQRRGYHRHASDQIMKAYIKITKNKIRHRVYFSSTPKGSNSDFLKFSSWVGNMEKKHSLIFSEFKKFNGQIDLLKENRKKLQSIYICS